MSFLGIGEFLTYLRLKCVIVLLRLIYRLTVSLPKGRPSDTYHIPSRDPRRAIKIHVYEARDPVEPSPVLINFHGSGFVLPLHGSDQDFCERIARETYYTVLDVEYRLSPEHPFPAPLHDAEDVVRWVLDHPKKYDKDRIALSGFSAGGNIVAGIAGAIFPPGTFRSMTVFYCSANKSVPREKRHGRNMAASVGRLVDAAYIPPSIDRKDPRLSPIYAPMQNFPPNVLVVTAALDSLATFGEAFATKIKDAGGHHVVQRKFDGCGHGWDKKAKPGSVQAKARDEAYDMVIAMLRL